MKCVRYETRYCGCLDLHPWLGRLAGGDGWQGYRGDVTWVREQPGHRGEEDNAAAFQVLVALWPLCGSSRSPGVCCRKCRSRRLRPPWPLLPAPPCSHDSRSQTGLEANAVSTEIRERGTGRGGGRGRGGHRGIRSALTEEKKESSTVDQHTVHGTLQ